MKVGLYFGSFNPIHIGHLIIASHILNEGEIQKVWFVVSLQNPFKQTEDLLNENDRLRLVQRAIENDSRLRVTDIEFNLSKPSYTIHTLTYLKEKYPEHQFYVIMGSDSYQTLTSWKNSEIIIADYPIIVYLRPGFNVEKTYSDSTKIMNAQLLEISATHIRGLIRSGKSIKYLVPLSVEKEIYNSDLFKKAQKK